MSLSMKRSAGWHIVWRMQHVHMPAGYVNMTVSVFVWYS